MKFSHLLPFSLILIPIAWGIYGYVKTKKESKSIADNKFSVLPVIINSAVLYALAFNIIFFIINY